jgi:hypothetical protein
MTRPVPLAVTFLLLLSVVAGVAVADEQVIGRPEVSLFAPDNVLVPGTDTTLDFFVVNDGQLTRGGPAPFEERVTTARAVRVEPLAEAAPLTVRTGPVPVGSVPEGTAGPFGLRVTVDEDAEPGTYEIPVRISYAYTRIVTYDETDEEASPSYSEASVTRRATLTVQIENRPRFAVVDVETDVAVGSRGTVTVEVSNVGTRTARDATVAVASADPDLRVTTGESATVAAGDWAPGETRRVTVEARAADTPATRDYPLRLTVDYDDDEGVRRTARTLTATVRPQERATFEIERVESDLAVGRRGAVEGVLVYRGERPLDDVTLRLLESGSLAPTETAYPLGTLDPGERVPFRFTLDVPRNASPGPRRFPFRVEYDAANERQFSGTLSAVAPVDPYREVFRVEARESRVAVDGESRLVVELTNLGDDPVRDATARLSVTEPLESDVTEAFVGSLAPGESTTVAFALSATDEAIPSTLPATVHVAYTDETGRDVVSDPATVGVRVVEEESSLPVPVLVAVVVAVVGAGVWWSRRR